MSLTSKVIIEKQPSETINAAFDLSTWCASEDIIISNPVVSASSDLTITGVEVSSQTVTMQIAGGTAGKNYRVVITFDTSDDESLEADGILKVRGR